MSRTGRRNQILEIAILAYKQMPKSKQAWFCERCAISICIAIACISSSFFYFSLEAHLRVVLVPILIGLSCFVGAKFASKLATPERIQNLFDWLETEEFHHLIEAVKFSTLTLSCSAIPLLFSSQLFMETFSNEEARICYLSLIAWSFIGVPLYAQSNSTRLRLLFLLVFAVPVVVASLLMSGELCSFI